MRLWGVAETGAVVILPQLFPQSLVKHSLTENFPCRFTHFGKSMRFACTHLKIHVWKKPSDSAVIGRV